MNFNFTSLLHADVSILVSFVLLSLAVFTLLAIFARTVSFLFFPPINLPSRYLAYECGFSAYVVGQYRFNVSFYLVAILFLLFDVELVFLIPWAVLLPLLGCYGFWVVIVFMSIVTLGFIVEYLTKSLNFQNV